MISNVIAPSDFFIFINNCACPHWLIRSSRLFTGLTEFCNTHLTRDLDMCFSDPKVYARPKNIFTAAGVVRPRINIDCLINL